MALPIRARLTWWYSCVLAVTVVGLGVFLVLRLRADLMDGLDATLSSRAQQVALALSDPQDQRFVDVQDGPKLIGVPPGDGVAQVISPSGRLLQSTGEDEVDRPLLSVQRTRSISSGEFVTTRIGSGSDRFRLLAVRRQGSSDLLLVGTSVEPVDETVRRMIVQLLLAGPAVVALSALGGYVLARRALRPIDRMTSEASQIGSDDLDRRLKGGPANDEVARLARTLNSMLKRLQDA